MNPPSFLSELKRKAFHLTALIYVAGAWYLSRTHFIAAVSVLFVTALMTEIIRLRAPGVKELFFKYFGGLMRESEWNRFTGVIWLLAGVLVSALILEDRILIVTALLYVILGDTAASLVGIGLGGPKWLGSNKTISGSVACWVCCVGIGAWCLRPDYAWNGILIGAAVATVVESGMIKVNDNFLIPAASALALSLVYGLR